MKPVLLLGGGANEIHPFAGLQPLYAQIIQEQGVDVISSEDPDSLCSEHIRGFRAVVCCATNLDFSESQYSGLETALGRGEIAYIGLHAAATCGNTTPAYTRMLGGRFLAHPEIGPEIQVRCVHREASEGILNGVADFCIADELYLMEEFDTGRHLLESEYDGFPRPLAWIKPFGMGRVFYSALGHSEAHISHPMLRRFVGNGIAWALG